MPYFIVGVDMGEIEKARAIFEEIRIWERVPNPIPLSSLVEGLNGPDAEFIELIYSMAKSFYDGRKPRNNGEHAFTHPTHVALYLKKAHAQPHLIAAGLLHDVLEDRADDMGPVKDPLVLDQLLIGLRGKFATEIVAASNSALFPRHVAERVVEIVWTLTRHKAHRYYRSISAIFNHPDNTVKVGAALVKLADRMHNIQTIDNYNDDEKLYQCFKNIFILNNAKHLKAEFHSRVTDKRLLDTIDKAFKKSGKATFQALLRIQHETEPEEDVFDLVTYLSLALRKFVLEINGLWKVQHAQLSPGVPVWNLFHGIVEKYDQRLHREDNAFQAHVQAELDYCRATFSPLGLTEKDLHKAIYLKDAMALSEVVASLLYRDDYVILGFECGRLCRRGKNCMKS